MPFTGISLRATRARLGNNPRTGIVFKQLADMKKEERQAIADRAGYIRLHLNEL